MRLPGPRARILLHLLLLLLLRREFLAAEGLGRLTLSLVLPLGKGLRGLLGILLIWKLLVWILLVGKLLILHRRRTDAGRNGGRSFLAFVLMKPFAGFAQNFLLPLAKLTSEDLFLRSGFISLKTEKNFFKKTEKNYFKKSEKNFFQENREKFFQKIRGKIFSFSVFSAKEIKISKGQRFCSLVTCLRLKSEFR